MNRWPSDKRISAENYARRLKEIYADPGLRTRSSQLSPNDIKRLEHLECNLLLDHRLGVDFPIHRRKLIWEIIERAKKQRIRIALRYFWGRLTGKGFAAGLQGILELVSRDLSRLLDKEEYRALVGEEHGASPRLPMDTDKLT